MPLTNDGQTWDDFEELDVDGRRCTYFPRDAAQNIIDAVIIGSSRAIINEAVVDRRNPEIAALMRDIRCAYTGYVASLASGRSGRRCVQTEMVAGVRFEQCPDDGDV